MHEGLQLFEEVVQNPIFQNTPMFVFLNKKDLFEQMMREDGVPLTRCFPDYRVSYILEVFCRLEVDRGLGMVGRAQGTSKRVYLGVM